MFSFKPRMFSKSIQIMQTNASNYQSRSNLKKFHYLVFKTQYMLQKKQTFFIRCHQLRKERKNPKEKQKHWFFWLFSSNNKSWLDGLTINNFVRTSSHNKCGDCVHEWKSNYDWLSVRLFVTISAVIHIINTEKNCYVFTL